MRILALVLLTICPMLASAKWGLAFDRARLGLYLGFIQQRCLMYSGPAGQEKCPVAVNLINTSLDVRYAPTAVEWSEPVIFATELMQALEDPLTGACLQLVNSDLNATREQMMPSFDFFTSLGYCDGGRENVSRIVGTLFQDVRANSLHFDWLKTQALSANQQKTLKMTLNFIKRVERTLLERPDLKLSFVTSDPQVSWAGLYHYYVPYVLAGKLVAGGADRCAAMTSVFFFNYMYEIYELIGSKGAFNEPRTIEKSGALEDIYLGLKGAIEGSGVDVQVDRSIISEMSANPRQTIQKIISSCH